MFQLCIGKDVFELIVVDFLRGKGYPNLHHYIFFRSIYYDHLISTLGLLTVHHTSQ